MDRKSMIKRENYMKQIRPFINGELIKVLTGIRRCGKSVMLELIKEELSLMGIGCERFISFNFESLKNASFCTAQALYDEVMRQSASVNGKVYFFFDEIQEVESWEKCINSLRVDLDCDIYITGSNAKLLSGELATFLAGRYIEFEITPFSFSEFLALYRTVHPTTSERDAFNHYLIFGGMPYLSRLQYQKEACSQYLNDLYSAVQLKDIIRRNKIRDVDLLDRVLAYVTTNIGNTFSAASLCKYLKSENRRVSPETMLNYIKACTEAFLFYQVKRHDLQGKKLLSVNEKYYVSDHGLREAVFGGNLRDINLVLENIVYLELRRRGFDVTVGRFGDKEIDFVCQKQDKRIYIQVAYLLASPETVEREFGVFSDVKDNFPKYVLSLDDYDMSQNGIVHLNLRDFLLKSDWE